MQHSQRAEVILAAARAVFAERGYGRASMVDIARRAGIVEGTIYKHFRGKRELLYRVTRDFYEPLIAGAAQEVSTVEGARNQLRLVVWRLLTELTREGGLSRVLIRALRPSDDEYRDAVVDLQRAWTRLLVDIIERGVASGELRADTPVRMVRDVVASTVEHLVWRAVNEDRPIDAATASDELTDVVLRGVAAADRTITRLDDALDRLQRLIERGERP